MEGSRLHARLSALPEALVARVPELAEAMESEATFWAELEVAPLGLDTAFHNVVVPFVADRLQRDQDGTDDVLRRVFAFLEELAATDDPEKLSVVDVSFAEAFLDDWVALERSQPYVSPRLNERLRLVQRHWKKPRWQQRLRSLLNSLRKKAPV